VGHERSRFSAGSPRLHHMERPAGRGLCGQRRPALFWDPTLRTRYVSPRRSVHRGARSTFAGRCRGSTPEPAVQSTWPTRPRTPPVNASTIPDTSGWSAHRRGRERLPTQPALMTSGNTYPASVVQFPGPGLPGTLSASGSANSGNRLSQTTTRPATPYSGISSAGLGPGYRAARAAQQGLPHPCKPAPPTEGAPFHRQPRAQREWAH